MSQLKHAYFWGLAALIILLAACSGRNQGQLRPDTPERIPIGTVNPDPIPLSFGDLDTDPFFPLNKLVQVTGSYKPVSNVVCSPFKGPRPRWGLVAEGLQMDIVGGYDIVSILPENAELTVDGVWKLYEGPLGCGKEPADGTRWYLDVQRIERPNPLIINAIIGPTDPIAGGEGITIPTPTPTSADEQSGEEGELPPDPGGLIPTATSDSGDLAPLPTSGSPTNTPRPTNSPIPTAGATGSSGGLSTPTPTPTSTPTLTPTPGGTAGTTTPGDDSGLATSAPTTPDAVTPPGSYGGNNGGGGNNNGGGGGYP